MNPETGRVFFGHQSVGQNIVDAVQRAAPGAGSAPVKIVGPDETPIDGSGFLCHARLGVNGDPMSKTREFATLVEGPLGEVLDIALHKYCYVDVRRDTDVSVLFQHYERSMTALERTRPHVLFVHVTVPLVSLDRGPGAAFRRMLGKVDGRAVDNQRREAFNDLLRHRYGTGGALFDLAALEAGDDGAVAQRPARPRQLLGRYASDGRHLNAAGSSRIAEELLRFLKHLYRQRETVPAR